MLSLEDGALSLWDSCRGSELACERASQTQEGGVTGMQATIERSLGRGETVILRVSGSRGALVDQPYELEID